MATTAKYWQRGEALDYINSGDETIAANEIIDLTTRIGVAGMEIEPDTKGSVHVEGVYAIAKTDSTEVISLGAAVYYDGTGITAADTSGTPAGYAVEESDADSETVLVKLLG